MEQEFRTPSHLYAIKTLGEEAFKKNKMGHLNNIISKITPHWWHFYFFNKIYEDGVGIIHFDYQMVIDLLTEWTKNPPPAEVLHSFQEDINFDQEAGDFGPNPLKWKNIYKPEDDWDQVETVSKLLSEFGSKFIFPITQEQLKFVEDNDLDLTEEYIMSFLAAVKTNPKIMIRDKNYDYEYFSNWIVDLIKNDQEQELIEVLEKWRDGQKVHPLVLEQVREMLHQEHDWFEFYGDSCHHQMTLYDALLWVDDYCQITKNEKLLELVIIFGKFELEKDKRIDNYIRFGKTLERLRAGKRIP